MTETRRFYRHICPKCQIVPSVTLFGSTGSLRRASCRARCGLEAQYLRRLLHVGDATLTSYSNGASLTKLNGFPSVLNLAPNGLGKLEHTASIRGRDVESSLSALGCSMADTDALREITPVTCSAGLDCHLEDVQRILPFEDLLHQVGDHVAYRELTLRS